MLRYFFKLLYKCQSVPEVDQSQWLSEHKNTNGTVHTHRNNKDSSHPDHYCFNLGA